MGTETGLSSDKKRSLLGYLQISMAVVRQLHFLFTQQILQQQPYNTLSKFYVHFILIYLDFLFIFFSQLSRNVMIKARENVNNLQHMQSILDVSVKCPYCSLN